MATSRNNNNRLEGQSKVFQFVTLSVLFSLPGALCQDTVCEEAAVSEFHTNGYRCTIAQDRDFREIPTNVGALDLKFSARHTVDLSLGLVPNLRDLVYLKMDITHVGYLPSDAFSNVPSLQQLSLYHVSPENREFNLVLDQAAFTGLRQLKELHLVDLGIRSLPSKIFKDLISLENLDINMNLLENVPQGVFSNLQNLNVLSLARNHIEDLHQVSFTGLESLTTLNIYSNDVRVLKAGSFDHLQSLTELNLEGNDMLSIDNGAFSGLDNLQNLYLEQNNLSEIHPGMFSGAANLLALRLNDNDLSSVGNDAFSNTPSLMVLNLADNDLEYISPEALDNLQDLRYLVLSGNKLDKLDPQLLHNKPNLEELDISNNEIKELDSEVFHELYTLRYLLLSGNPMTFVPVSAFQDLDALEELSLPMTSWHCDCELYWLNLWLQIHGLQQQSKISSALCDSPVELKGRSIPDIYTTNTLGCVATTVAPSRTTTYKVTKIYVPVQTRDNTVHNSSINSGLGGEHEEDDEKGGHLSNSAKAGIIAGLIILAALIIAVTAFGIYSRQKRYAFWSPSKDKDDEEKRVGLFYRARHRVPSVYRDPQTGRMENILDIQQEEADARKEAKRKAKAASKASKNVVPVKKTPLNAIREEEDSSKTQDIDKDRRNGANGMLGLDLHLDLDDTFEIDVDTPPRLSPTAKSNVGTERSRPKSQPSNSADLSCVLRDSGIGNSIAEISMSPNNESHMGLDNHDSELVPISQIDENTQHQTSGNDHKALADLSPSRWASTSNPSQNKDCPTMNNKHFSKPLKASTNLSYHDNNNTLKNTVNDNSSNTNNPDDKIEMNYIKQKSNSPSKDVKAIDTDSGTLSCADELTPHKGHDKLAVPSPPRSLGGSEGDQSMESYEGVSFNDSQQHYPSTQDLVYM